MSENPKRPRLVPAPPPPLELPLADLAAIVERTQTEALTASDHAKLKAAMATLAFLTAELQAKKTSLERLRRMLFGARTEKTRTVLKESATEPVPGPETAGSEAQSPSPAGSQPHPKAPGHGRHGVSAYTGARQVTVAHPTLQAGHACPHCGDGTLYRQNEPGTLVRITGMAPLSATVYACARLRCHLCGEVTTAPPPEGVGPEKYDATATSMVGLLKYGAGLPFNRIATLQAGMGIPLPAATQWDLVRAAAKALAPAHAELVRQAAQAPVLYNDDTTMKVLQLTRAQRAAALADDAATERTGIFTSGIVATEEGRQIALFFTGVRHAGENLAAVLAHRAADRPAPIQMCDGLSRNAPPGFDTVMSSCLAHARRKSVELIEAFPDQVRFVLETLRAVYITDDGARQQGLTPAERLHRHQAESGPRMAALEQWMQTQFAERTIEPNSTLGAALRYMQKRWSELTVFLRVPGAPLDNNLCERILKKAILHRKNALFYRTLNGAHVGDLFMSLIHTAELNHVAPFEYLVALQRHADEVTADPGAWMPWNYQATLGLQNPDPEPPD
ncbi:IS66 family transposase [Acidiferrobacter sp.]|uniref:IS66 family transposase n=1 Tax=Acidiferrobacter sp. TaxID=1872107 RepID=UPI002633C1EE|nr:IS66 family transposase [Acidiferrobacter sp.]